MPRISGAGCAAVQQHSCRAGSAASFWCAPESSGGRDKKTVALLRWSILRVKSHLSEPSPKREVEPHPTITADPRPGRAAEVVGPQPVAEAAEG